MSNALLERVGRVTRLGAESGCKAGFSEMTVGWAATMGWRRADDGLRTPVDTLELLLTEVPEQAGSFKESRSTSTCNCTVVEILGSVNADRFGSSDAEPTWKSESDGGTGVLVALDGAVGDR